MSRYEVEFIIVYKDGSWSMECVIIDFSTLTLANYKSWEIGFVATAENELYQQLKISGITKPIECVVVVEIKEL